MKPSTQTANYEQLVQRVNELYHDFLNEGYHEALPEIFELEGERWRRLAREFIVPLCQKSGDPRGLTIVEIGSGTGFVPLTIGPLLKRVDAFICTDISQGILDVARRNLEKTAAPCRFEFRKTQRAIPLRLAAGDGEADVVLMNSVLHHIADTAGFFAEIDRILKPGGRLIIAHEPNRYFYEHLILMNNYRLWNAVFNCRSVIIGAARRIGLLGALRRIYYFFKPSLRHQMGEKSRFVDTLCARINERIVDEGFAARPLANQTILDLVDARAGEGFYPDRLLPAWRLIHLETYHHLFWVMVYHHRRALVRRADAWLGRRWPTRGATFAVVYEKPMQPASAFKPS